MGWVRWVGLLCRRVTKGSPNTDIHKSHRAPQTHVRAHLVNQRAVGEQLEPRRPDQQQRAGPGEERAPGAARAVAGAAGGDVGHPEQ